MTFLQIKDLKKVYPKSDNLPPALENINLQINNRGLVFVVGKSGSGKSTLLNLIGGLDSATDGTIILKGHEYSSYKEEDFDSLRKNEIGFIFQDFCLIDGLNVLENVRLAATIKDQIVDEEKIYKAIEAVGLKGYETHLAHELSAGQRQRVAIARAIIKSPEILLCDEPTGNLDFVTSHEILNLLKELSQKSLVIIVSHNLEDAYVFADRIIELKAGHVINDLEADQSQTIIDDTAYISGIDFLGKKELEEINHKIENGEIKRIKSRKELFKPYVHKDSEYDNIVYPKQHISIKKSVNLMNSLLKKQFLKIGLFSFIAALVASIFAVSFMFVNVNKKVIYKQIAEQTPNISTIYRKTNDEGYHPTQVYNISEKELEKARNLLPNEDIYPMVSLTSFWSDVSYHNAHNYPIYDGTSYSNYHRLFDGHLYVKESSGVLIVDEDFIKELLHLDNLEYVALADEIKPYGIYVTDLVVEQYIQRKELNKTPIDYVGQLINSVSNVNKYNSVYINGVIKTNYKVEYQDVLSELDNLRKNNPGGIKRYKESKVFGKYAEDIYHRYLNGFSFNANFLKDYQEADSYNTLRIIGTVASITYNGEQALVHDYTNTSFGNYGTTSRLVHYTNYQEDLPDHTVVIPNTVLNNIFQVNLTPEQWNETLDTKFTIEIYDPVSNIQIGTTSYDLIVGKSFASMAVSLDVLQEMRGYITQYSSLMVSEHTNQMKIFSSLADNSFMCLNVSTLYIAHITKGITTYIDFFKIILSIAVVALLAIVAFVSYNNVRRFTYEIGVIKSLGATSKDVYKIFSIQEFYLLLTSIIFSIAGVYIAALVSNNVLAAAFNYNFKANYIIHILTVDYVVLLVVVALIVIISLISMIIPLIHMKKLKPINILKSRY